MRFSAGVRPCFLSFTSAGLVSDSRSSLTFLADFSFAAIAGALMISAMRAIIPRLNALRAAKFDSSGLSAALIFFRFSIKESLFFKSTPRDSSLIVTSSVRGSFTFLVVFAFAASMIASCVSDLLILISLLFAFATKKSMTALDIVVLESSFSTGADVSAM